MRNNVPSSPTSSTASSTSSASSLARSLATATTLHPIDESLHSYPHSFMTLERRKDTPFTVRDSRLSYGISHSADSSMENSNDAKRNYAFSQFNINKETISSKGTSIRQSALDESTMVMDLDINNKSSDNSNPHEDLSQFRNRISNVAELDGVGYQKDFAAPKENNIVANKEDEHTVSDDSNNGTTDAIEDGNNQDNDGNGNIEKGSNTRIFTIDHVSFVAEVAPEISTKIDSMENMDSNSNSSSNNSMAMNHIMTLEHHGQFQLYHDQPYPSNFTRNQSADSSNPVIDHPNSSSFPFTSLPEPATDISAFSASNSNDDINKCTSSKGSSSSSSTTLHLDNRIDTNVHLINNPHDHASSFDPSFTHHTTNSSSPDNNFDANMTTVSNAGSIRNVSNISSTTHHPNNNATNVTTAVHITTTSIANDSDTTTPNNNSTINIISNNHTNNSCSNNVVNGLGITCIKNGTPVTDAPNNNLVASINRIFPASFPPSLPPSFPPSLLPSASASTPLDLLLSAKFGSGSQDPSLAGPSPPPSLLISSADNRSTAAANVGEGPSGSGRVTDDGYEGGGGGGNASRSQSTAASPMLPPVQTGDGCADDEEIGRKRSSKFRGVTRHKRSGRCVWGDWSFRWEAHIWVKSIGRQVYLGGYEKEDHAAEAYDVAALKCKGHKVKTNFPLARYSDLLRAMDAISLEELIMAVRRQSQGFSRGSSTFRGVTAHPSGRWESRIGVPGSKHIYLGLFEAEAEAARSYDRALIRLRGTSAATNYALAEYKKELEEFQRTQQALLGGDKRVEGVMKSGPEFEKWIRHGVSVFPFLIDLVRDAFPSKYSNNSGWKRRRRGRDA